MTALMLVLHVFVCLVLIMVILLQTGKGAEMGATFGVGSSSAVFGPRGPTPLLAKVTVAAAVIFMVTSLVLTIFASRQEAPSLLKGMSSPPAAQQPVQRAVQPPIKTPDAAGSKKAVAPGAKDPVQPTQGDKSQAHGR